MLQRILLVGIVLTVLMAPINILSAASDEYEVYFNAGTEKYLQGKFIEAIESLEMAESLNPGNSKIKEFKVRILLDAANQKYMVHDYKKAYVYLQKARNIDPENKKVIEMYQLTESLMADKSSENISLIKTPEVFNKIFKEDIVNVEEPVKSKTVKKPDTKAKKYSNAKIIKASVEAGQNIQTESTFHVNSALLIWAVSSTFLFLIALVVLLSIRSALKRLLSAMKESDEKISHINEQKHILEMENQKIREQVKYERQIAEKMNREINETKKMEQDKLQIELNITKKTIEEKLRSEYSSKNLGKQVVKDTFLNHQQKKFNEYMNDSSSIEDTASPALESARERIALMAQNLYEYAPGAAIEFLKKMSENSNPLIRSNVVKALSCIPKKESLDLLFSLYNDSDPKVKRETLKNLKRLIQEIFNGTVSVEPEIEEKIKNILTEERAKGEWIM